MSDIIRIMSDIFCFFCLAFFLFSERGFGVSDTRAVTGGKNLTVFYVYHNLRQAT